LIYNDGGASKPANPRRRASGAEGGTAFLHPGVDRAPLASRWYPPEYQGIALGIAGAGNSGTVLAAATAALRAGRIDAVLMPLK
jgi:hypothetical protein